jgi:tRNA threonylcarbamoyladenosine biosynthesis protein TsaB
MRLLLIHTAGIEGTVALASGSEVIATAVLPGRSSSERLVPEVRRIMEAAGWSLSELAAVVVVHGPGSFTGVRVGISAAKGLCEAGDVAVIAVSRLALLAAAIQTETGVVHAVLDAGGGQFFYGSYENGVCLSEVLLTSAEVIAAVLAAGKGTVLSCEAQVIEGLPALSILRVPEASAGDAVPLALKQLTREAWDDVALLEANYLRRTDLEMKAKLENRARAEGSPC